MTSELEMERADSYFGDS